jgi:hypothetical protein
MLQEIVKKFKKKSWLRVCTLHNLNKWDLIDLTQAPVYPSKHFINEQFVVKTRVCNVCKKDLDLGIYHGNFIISRGCSCGNGTNSMSVEKLRCVLDESQCKLAIQYTTAARKKGLANTTEYWTARGYSIDEAKEKISNVQKNRSACSPASKKGARGYSTRTVEYWTNRGHTEVEARALVSKSQVTNGMKYYQDKFGERGIDMFNDRIKYWL